MSSLSILEQFTLLANGSPQGVFFWMAFNGLLGLCAGSFINVLLFRLPIIYGFINSPQWYSEQLSLSLPRSQCWLCTAPIRWWDNIPLVSFILLAGRSRCCHQPISWQYPLIELVAMLIALLIAWGIRQPLDCWAMMFFCYCALSLLIFDFKYYWLPDNINYALLWSGLLYQSWYNQAEVAIIGAVIGYSLFWAINWFYRLWRKMDGLGYGDCKLLAALTVWLGWQQLPMLLLISSVGGLLFGVILMIRHKQWQMTTKIAYGPWLLLAAVGLLMVRFL